MHLFDPKAPYDQVFGIPGITYSQGGCLFNPQGQPVTYRREPVPGSEDGRLVIELLPVGKEAVAPPVVAASVPMAEKYRSMHWKQLEALLGQYGQAFTTREEAVAFLTGEPPPPRKED